MDKEKKTGIYIELFKKELLQKRAFLEKQSH